jgi:hypothetical protein
MCSKALTKLGQCFIFLQDLPRRDISGTFCSHSRCKSLLKCPLVLPSDFFLFLRCEIVLDVEGLSNLLGCLPLDHVRNSLASQIQQVLDIQVVGSLFTSQTPISVSTFLTHPMSTGILGVWNDDFQRVQLLHNPATYLGTFCNITYHVPYSMVTVGQYNAGCPTQGKRDLCLLYLVQHALS